MVKKIVTGSVGVVSEGATAEEGEPFNADDSARRPSFGVAIRALGGRPRRYDVDIRHVDGAAWKRIVAQIVCDPFGPSSIVVDGWEMYVCLCKAGGVAAAHPHTCHRVCSDAEWIATAVDRYLSVHPEKFIPELWTLGARGRPS